MPPITALATMMDAVLIFARQQRRVEASSSNTSIDGASDDGEDDHPENSDDFTGKFSKPLACLPHSIHANTPHRFEFDWV